MNEPTEGRVLLVGEGNFSLSASLVEGGTISGAQLIASCLDTFTAVQENHQLAAANIEFLEKAGGTVLFEVDATDLHNHPDIQFYQFERVIFNFPLADRHNIKKNRALLSDFFSSVKNILDPESGQVMVTLCKGQGGTPADQPIRSWHDSWQVTSMAANAGFILTQIYPFHTQDFSRYNSVGFRFQDKSFNTDSALTHVFEVASSVSVPAIIVGRCVIPQDSQEYVVPPYIHRKHERWSLLDQKDHPVSILHHYLAVRISPTFPKMCVLPPNPSPLPKVLPGYASSLHLLHSASAHTLTAADSEIAQQAASDGEMTQMDGSDMTGGIGVAETRVNDVTSQIAAGESCEGGSGSKHWKDLKNRQTVAANRQVSESKEREAQMSDSQVCDSQIADSSKATDDRQPGSDVCVGAISRRSFQHGVDREGGQIAGPSDCLSAVPFSTLTCPVFVVHVPAQYSTRHGGHGDVPPQASVGMNRAGDSEENGRCDEGAQAMDTGDGDNVNTDARSSEAETTESGVDLRKGTPPDDGTIGHLSKDTVTTDGHFSRAGKTESGIDLKEETPLGNGICIVDNTPLFHLRCSLLENLPHLQRHMKMKSLGAVFTSAIVYRKCPISPAQLGASHESILLVEMAESFVDKLASDLCESIKLHMDTDSRALVTVTPTSQYLTVRQTGRVHIQMALTLQSGGVHEGSTLGYVFVYDSDGDDESGGEQGTGNGGPGLGHSRMLGAVVHLDTILLYALRLPDVRLLWSQDKRFRQQYTEGSTPHDLPAFRPISVYPVRFVHDISFWESGKRVFEEGEFLDVVRDVADDSVTSVTLIDKFEDGASGKTSRCYRLVFQSHDHALSYITSWKLQSILRLKVAQQLGVTLR